MKLEGRWNKLGWVSWRYIRDDARGTRARRDDGGGMAARHGTARDARRDATRLTRCVKRTTRR
jgi:hypothetical protein